MSELINCKKCGSVFRKSFRDICPNCIEKEHKEINMINEYIQKQGSEEISLEVLSDDLNIVAADIQYYISKGRLTEACSQIRQKCRICGIKLPTHYAKIFVCEKCRESVEKTIEETKIEAKANRDSSYKNRFQRNEDNKSKSTKFGFKKSYE